MGEIEGKVLDILFLKTKPISIGKIYEPSNNNFIGCVDKNTDDIKFHNEIFLLKNFNKNILHLHDSKCILIDNLAMHS